MPQGQQQLVQSGSLQWVCFDSLTENVQELLLARLPVNFNSERLRLFSSQVAGSRISTVRTVSSPAILLSVICGANVLAPRLAPAY